MPKATEMKHLKEDRHGVNLEPRKGDLVVAMSYLETRKMPKINKAKRSWKNLEIIHASFP